MLLILKIIFLSFICILIIYIYLPLNDLYFHSLYCWSDSIAIQTKLWCISSINLKGWSVQKKQQLTRTIQTTTRNKSIIHWLIIRKILLNYTLLLLSKGSRELYFDQNIQIAKSIMNRLTKRPSYLLLLL